MLGALTALGVGVAHVRRVDLPTSVTEVTITAAGDRRFSGFFPGAAEAYEVTPSELEGLVGYEFVHVTSLPGLPRQLAAIVAHARSVSCDFSDDEPPEPCAGLDLAVVSVGEDVSDDEAAAAASDLVVRGAALGLALRGAAGSLTFDGERMVRVAALHVDAVDTCGAGDAYIACLLAERHAGVDLEAAMRRATRTAAKACGHTGAYPLEWLTSRPSSPG